MDIPKINYSGLCGLLTYVIKLNAHTKTNVFSKRKRLNVWLVLKCQHHQK